MDKLGWLYRPARAEQERASCLASSESNVAALERRGIDGCTAVDKFHDVLGSNPWEAMPECFADDAKEDWP